MSDVDAIIERLEATVVRADTVTGEKWSGDMVRWSAAEAAVLAAVDARTAEIVTMLLADPHEKYDAACGLIETRFPNGGTVEVAVSDLTPEETLHDSAFLSPSGETVLLVPLDVALAAVAAERERLEAALLTDKVADEVEATRGAAGAGDDAYNTAAMLSALRAGVALAREGFRDE